MKTIFIVNPKAGKDKSIKKFISVLKVTTHSLDADVYVTKKAGDATQFVREYCQKSGVARFIACGGDGTLNEVLNGAIGFEGAQVGVIPLGTGNDFCRNFKSSDNFNNILLQIKGKASKCDVIKYSTFVDGIKREGFCANMFNIGFDCSVVDMTSYIKEKTFLFGPLAYFVSIFLTLIKKKCSNLKIELDGITKHNGELLLTSIANGSYCGGGVKSNPYASVNDGLININIIKNLSRFKFISLLPYYMKGTLLEKDGIDNYVLSEKCKKVKVTPLNGNIRICVDGEVLDASEVEFEVIHNGFDFVLP